MAQKFRNKPEVIEAVRFTGSNLDEVGVFVGGNLGMVDQKIVIAALRRLHVNWGDWIIRGVNGELRPCKPDIFEMTYEAVSE